MPDPRTPWSKNHSLEHLRAIMKQVEDGQLVILETGMVKGVPLTEMQWTVTLVRPKK